MAALGFRGAIGRGIYRCFAAGSHGLRVAVNSSAATSHSKEIAGQEAAQLLGVRPCASLPVVSTARALIYTFRFQSVPRADRAGATRSRCSFARLRCCCFSCESSRGRTCEIPQDGGQYPLPQEIAKQHVAEQLVFARHAKQGLGSRRFDSGHLWLAAAFRAGQDTKC